MISSLHLPSRFLLLFRRNPALLLHIARRYGDVVQAQFGGYRIVLLNHPDAIKDVLATQHRCFTKGGAHQRAKEWLGNGVLVSEGDEHRHQRRYLQPAFQPQRIAEYAPLIVAEGAHRCARWHAGQTIDVAHEMLTLALTIVVKTLIRVDITDDELTLLNAALNELAASFHARAWPWTALREQLSQVAHQRRAYLHTALDQIVYRLMDLHTQEANLPDNMLTLLFHATTEDGQPLTRKQIRDELVTLLLAGRETVAAALTWSWYLIAQYPHVEAHLHAELDQVLAGQPPQAHDIASLGYTRMLFTEALRLYPPAWATGRRATIPCTLAGTDIPAQSFVLMSQYVTHRDPRYYADPQHCEPLRWSETAQTERPRFAFFPFGGGARRCLGEALAWAEGVLLIATIAQQWQLRLLPGQTVSLAARTSLQPNRGLPMIATRRRPG